VAGDLEHLTGVGEPIGCLPVRGSFASQRVAEALIGRVRVDFTIPQIRAKKEFACNLDGNKAVSP
jgi:hypothetical protein